MLSIAGCGLHCKALHTAQVFAQLFPELYRVSLSDTSEVFEKPVEHHKIEKLITALINNMVSNDRKKRCSAKDALGICIRLIENSQNIEEGISKCV